MQCIIATGSHIGISPSWLQCAGDCLIQVTTKAGSTVQLGFVVPITSGQLWKVYELPNRVMSMPHPKLFLHISGGITMNVVRVMTIVYTCGSLGS